MVGRGMVIWSRAKEWRPSTYANVQVAALIWGKLLKAYSSATDNSYTSFVSNWSVPSSKTVKTKFNLKKREKFATLVITDLSHICQFRAKYLKKILSK